MKNKLVSHNQQRSKARSVKSPHFDPEKLGIQRCSPAEAEAFARETAWKLLEDKAKPAGKKLNQAGRIPQEVCQDALWLLKAVHAVNRDMAKCIDEDLSKLTKPDARREELVGKIFVHIEIMRAAHAFFWGTRGNSYPTR